MLDGVPNEVVIVRRKNSWEDDHLPHGVWKIAYADFMTALMAFFLVMWLINVTDDSVRRGVAQYFNPVKLASTAPNRKGLNDPQINGDTNENGTKLFTGKLGGSEDPVDQDDNFGSGHEAGHKAKEVEETPETGGVPVSGQFTQTHAESILFSDPYAVLDTLAEKIRVAETLEDNPQGIGTGLQKHEGAQGGQAYRDPFDPLFWQFRPGRGVDGSEAAALGTPGQGQTASNMDLEGNAAFGAPYDEGNPLDAGITDTQALPQIAAISEDEELFSGAGEGTSDLSQSGTSQLSETGSRIDPVVAHVMGRSEQTVADGLEDPSTGSADTSTDPETDRLVARLSEVLAETDGTSLEKTAGLITVSREADGTLISLTDDQNFGMFAIGSAEPRPELVKLLERIGKVVAETPGQIVIKGHTDARPFRSKTYDNWRLSTARAHMARYMLTRGGVDQARFDRVEGSADRHLKVPGDPFAAGNRRIEIYLLEGGE
ncbi:MotB family protein [Roseibium sp.]|uniref:MotB family protein n=1 Tax=Roseibium sp. TaxID=1936156 RepID=UPI003BB046CD